MDPFHGTSNVTEHRVLCNEEVGAQALNKHARQVLHDKWKSLIDFPRNLFIEEKAIRADIRNVSRFLKHGDSKEVNEKCNGRLA
jgi:hypothetical protein